MAIQNYTLSDGSLLRMFIPIYANDTILSDYPEYYLAQTTYALEFFFATAFMSYGWVFCYAMYKHSVPHVNLRVIICSLIIGEYLCYCSRFFIFCYQIELLQLTGNIGSDWFVFLFGIYRIHFLSFATLSIPCFVIERTFATVWVAHYEHNKYPWISTSLILTNSSISAIFAGISLFGLLTIISCVLYFAIITFISVTTFFLLYVHNRKQIECLDKKRQNLNGEYNLRIRFQYNENWMTLKGMIRIVSLLAVIIIIALMMEYAPRLIPLSDFAKNLCYALTDMILAAAPVILLCSTVLLPKILDSVKAVIRKKKNSAFPLQVNVPTETEIYFKQLKSQW